MELYQNFQISCNSLDFPLKILLQIIEEFRGIRFAYKLYEGIETKKH